MTTEVTEWCRQCPNCCLRKGGAGVTRAPLVNISTSYPLELVMMDYLTLQRSSGGYENVLVITDHFTKLAVAVPTRDQTARTTAYAFWKHFVMVYGYPQRVHTDQGANFMSKLMKEMCILYGAAKSNTTPYHPQGNGLCERFNRTLIGMVSALNEAKKANWAQFLGELIFSYNNTIHRSTGYTPFFLMFGRHGRIPLHFSTPSLMVDQTPPLSTEWAKDHCSKLKFVHKLAQGSAAQAADRQKMLYDRKAKEVPLADGERVLLRNHNPRKDKKIGPFWKPNPYIIVSQPNPDNPVYCIKPERGEVSAQKLIEALLL
ncbi:uncharacterized protein K02A2.6-like [Lytechinus pictus]|uniref:uncharacterized protein K02A2.6-like n=1 Tax=Lytechinus pictus TaxID=7653 RepID=UPI0030B9AE73